MAENLVINSTTYPDVAAMAMTNEDGEAVGFYPDAVRYVQQALTDDQKAQVRENIGVTGDGERGLSIYRASVESGYMSSLLIDLSTLEIPSGFTPKNHDMVLTADNCLYYVDYLDEAAGQVALASYGGIVSLGGDPGLVVVQYEDTEEGLANYSASEIQELANQGREVVFRSFDDDGGFAEWKLWTVTAEQAEFRANTNIISGENRLNNTNLFVDDEKNVWFDESGLAVPRYLTDLADVPATASVGQILRVSAVDEEGYITGWEVVDLWTEEVKQEIIDAVLAALNGDSGDTNTETTATLGVAVLGKMILGKE